MNNKHEWGQLLIGLLVFVSNESAVGMKMEFFEVVIFLSCFGLDKRMENKVLS